jgi:uncharacterized protein (UPF0332 family)
MKGDMDHQTGLIIVGKHLLAEAANRPVDVRQSFLRSSVSRFYYAIFLTVRQIICEVGADPRPKHAAVPDMLRNTVQRKFKDQLNKAQKNSLVSNAESINIRNRVLNHTTQLALMVSQANEVRTKADYDLEEQLQSIGGDIKIGGLSVLEAERNFPQVRRLVAALMNDWRQIGGT